MLNLWQTQSQYFWNRYSVHIFLRCGSEAESFAINWSRRLVFCCRCTRSITSASAKIFSGLRGNSWLTAVRHHASCESAVCRATGPLSMWCRYHIVLWSVEWLLKLSNCSNSDHGPSQLFWDSGDGYCSTSKAAVRWRGMLQPFFDQFSGELWLNTDRSI